MLLNMAVFAWSSLKVFFCRPTLRSSSFRFFSDYPAVRHLNPEIRHGEQDLILATRLIAAVHRSSLRHTGNVADQKRIADRKARQGCDM